jgi:hypothetical protein
MLPIVYVSNQGGIMAVAKFWWTSEWAGKKIIREGDVGA